MKKIECIIMDWAGTAVDYGCFAPVAAFIEAFAEKGLTIDVVQTRKPMGLPKIQHIRELLSMPEVNGQFIARYQRAWTEEDVVELNRLFEKHLFASRELYRPYPRRHPHLGETACRQSENRLHHRLYPRNDGRSSSRRTGKRLPCGLLRHSQSVPCRTSRPLHDFREPDKTRCSQS